MKAIPSVDCNTLFVEAGVVALRDELTGGFRDPRPLFIAVDRSEVTPSGLLRSEQEQIDDLAAVLAGKFRQYIDGVKSIEKLQKGERT